MIEPFVQVVGGRAVALVHDCNAMCGDGVRRLIADRVVLLDERWRVEGPDEAASVFDSVRCEACGLHGHWVRGQWRPCAPGT